MADTFKFLNNKQSGGDAAQNFLNEKLSKNKYMSTSDPNNPYSMGEGSTPGGEAYEMDRKVLNQDEIDKFNANKGSGDWSGSGLSGNALKRYSAGQWGGGEMSAEEIREKFGLTDDEGAASGERAIYGTNADGSRVFIGNVQGDLTGNSELISAHGKQNLGGEADHSGDALSSDGDVKGAILNLWKAGEGEEAPKPVLEEMKPIEHSAEIKQAKDRVQQYEQDVMSGKTSKEIYGKGEDQASDKYTFDASQGAAAIGGSPIAKADANSAATSFLNKKVADTKKTLQLS